MLGCGLSAKQPFVRLNAGERQQVEHAVRSNKNSPRERLRARILLDAAGPAGWTDAQVADQMGASALTVGPVLHAAADHVARVFILLEGALEQLVCFLAQRFA